MKRRIIIISVAAAVLIAAAGIFLYMTLGTGSISRNLDLGNKYLDDGEYEKAVKAFERVIKADEENIEARIGLSEAYVELEDYESAEDILKETLDIDKGNNDAAAALAEILMKEEKYTEAAEVLTSPDLKKVTSKIKRLREKLIPGTPAASPAEGTFEEPDTEITLENAKDGEKIFYTTDNSDPDEFSFEYSGPIKLRKGENILKAVIQNDKGVFGEIVTFKYELKLPEIQEKSYLKAYAELVMKHRNNISEPLQAATLAELNGDGIPDLILLFNDQNKVLHEEYYSYGENGLTSIYYAEDDNSGNHSSSGVSFFLVHNEKDGLDYFGYTNSFMGQGISTDSETIQSFTGYAFERYLEREIVNNGAASESDKASMGFDGTKETYYVGEKETDKAAYEAKMGEFSEKIPIYDFISWGGTEGNDYTAGGQHILDIFANADPGAASELESSSSPSGNLSNGGDFRSLLDEGKLNGLEFQLDDGMSDVFNTWGQPDEKFDSDGNFGFHFSNKKMTLFGFEDSGIACIWFYEGASFSGITIGQKIDEVKAVLGEPDSVTPLSQDHYLAEGINCSTAIYQSASGRYFLEVYFDEAGKTIGAWLKDMNG